MNELSSLPLSGKRVFLRADFNVPLKDGVITDATRIDLTLPTLDFLIKASCPIVLSSHLGRPKNGFTEALSLRPVAEYLANKGYLIQLDSSKSRSETYDRVQTLGQREILLLENVRFSPEEIINGIELASFYHSLAPFYINDAFGAVHRPHASVDAVVDCYPSDHIAAGLLLAREIKALNQLHERPESPFVCIFGGAKITDKLPLIERFTNVADAIVIGGAMAYAFLKAEGFSIGNSLYDASQLSITSSIIKTLKKSKTRLILPVDHMVALSPTSIERPRVTLDANIAEGSMGLDIGPETIAAYQHEVMAAKTILWNGPMGLFENPQFSLGTIAIAEGVGKRCEQGCFGVVGGGDSLAAVNIAGVGHKISHVSSGGGATLEYLSGIKLPGLIKLNLYGS